MDVVAMAVVVIGVVPVVGSIVLGIVVVVATGMVDIVVDVVVVVVVGMLVVDMIGSVAALLFQMGANSCPMSFGFTTLSGNPVVS